MSRDEAVALAIELCPEAVQCSGYEVGAVDVEKIGEMMLRLRAFDIAGDIMCGRIEALRGRY
jgi:hypothetical protein